MITRSGMIRVRGPNDVPSGPHFAVIIYDTQSVYIPGDERSRTAPGHGYPAHNESFDTFEHWVTTNQQVLNAFIQEVEADNATRTYGRRPFTFFEVLRKGTLVHQTAVTF